MAGFSQARLGAVERKRYWYRALLLKYEEAHQNTAFNTDVPPTLWPTVLAFDYNLTLQS